MVERQAQERQVIGRNVFQLRQGGANELRNKILQAKQRAEEDYRFKLQILEAENKFIPLINSLNTYQGSTSEQSSRLFDKPFNSNWLFNSGTAGWVRVPYHIGTFREYVPSTNEIITYEFIPTSYISDKDFFGKPKGQVKVIKVEKIPLVSDKLVDTINYKLQNTPIRQSTSEDLASLQRARLDAQAEQRKLKEQSTLPSVAINQRIQQQEARARFRQENKFTRLSNEQIDFILKTGLTAKEVTKINTKYPTLLNSLIKKTKLKEAGFYDAKEKRKNLELVAKASSFSDAKKLLSILTNPSKSLEELLTRKEKELNTKEFVKASSLSEARSYLRGVTNVSETLDNLFDKRIEFENIKKKGFFSPKEFIYLIESKTEAERKRNLDILTRGLAVSKEVGTKRYIVKVEENGRIVQYIINLKTGKTTKIPYSSISLTQRKIIQSFNKIAQSYKEASLKRRVKAIGNVFGEISSIFGVTQTAKSIYRFSDLTLRSLLSKDPLARELVNRLSITGKKLELTNLPKDKLNRLDDYITALERQIKNPTKKDWDNFLKNKDTKEAGFIIGFILLIMASQGLFTFLAGMGGLAERFRKSIKAITPITRKLGFIGRSSKKAFNIALGGAELYFGYTSVKEFVNKPSEKSFANALVFGFFGFNTGKNVFRILTGKSSATIRGLKDSSKYFEYLIALEQTRLFQLRRELQLVKNKEEIAKLKKEIDISNKFLQNWKLGYKESQKFSKDKRIFKLDEFSDIISAKELQRLYNKQIDIFRTTGASIKDLTGQHFNTLIANRKKLTNLLKSNKSLLEKQSIKTLIKTTSKLRDGSKLGNILYTIFKRENIVLGGAKAMNLQVSRRFRRSTSDIDAKISKLRNAKRILEEIARLSNKAYNTTTFKVKKGGFKDTWKLVKGDKNILDLTKYDISKLDIIRSKDGILIETKYQLALNKIKALFTIERFGRKGMIDAKDFIRLLNNKVKLNQLLKTTKTPKDIMKVLDMSSTGKVSAERLRYKENFLFFSVLRVLNGYGVNEVLNKPLGKFIIDGLLGKNTYLVQRIKDAKISKFPKSLNKRINLARDNKLSIKQMDRLRKDLVAYVNKYPNKIFIGTRTSALGRGEEEVIMAVGSELRLINKKATTYYDSDIGKFVSVSDWAIGRKAKKVERAILNKAKILGTSSVLERYLLKLSDVDMRNSRRIIQGLQREKFLTKQNKNVLFNYVKKYVKKSISFLRKEVNKILKKIPYTIVKNEEFFKRAEAIINLLKKVNAKYKDITLKLNNLRLVRGTKRITKSIKSKLTKVNSSISSSLNDLNIKTKLVFYASKQLLLSKYSEYERRLSNAIRILKNRVKSYLTRPISALERKIRSVLNDIKTYLNKLGVGILFKFYDSKKYVSSISSLVGRKLNRYVRKVINKIIPLSTKSKLTKVNSSISSSLNDLNIKTKLVFYASKQLLLSKYSEYERRLSNAIRILKNRVKSYLTGPSSALERKIRSVLNDIKTYLNKLGVGILFKFNDSKKYVSSISSFVGRKLNAKIVNVSKVKKIKFIISKFNSYLNSTTFYSLNDKRYIIKVFFNKIKKQLTKTILDRITGVLAQKLRILRRTKKVNLLKLKSIFTYLNGFIPIKIILKRRLPKRIKLKRKTKKLTINQKKKKKELQKRLKEKRKIISSKSKRRLKLRQLKKRVPYRINRRTRTRTRVRARSRARTRTRPRTRTRTRTRVRARSRARTRTRPRTRTRVRTRSRARTRTRPRTRTRVRTRSRIIPKITPKITDKSDIKANSWYVELKKNRRSKYESIKKFRLTYSQAINFGRYLTDNLIQASFRLRPSTLKPNSKYERSISSKKFRVKKGRSKLIGNRVFVEKSKYRLDKRGEKSNISLAKIKRMKSISKIIKRLKNENKIPRKRRRKGNRR